MIVRSDSEALARWAGSRFGCTFVPPYVAWGITDRKGMVTAVAVFREYEFANIEVVAVGTGWTRQFLREAGQYCFGQLKRERVSITARMSDRLVHDLAVRLGARLEGIKRNYYAKGEDAAMYGVLKDEYRF